MKKLIIVSFAILAIICVVLLLHPAEKTVDISEDMSQMTYYGYSYQEYYPNYSNGVTGWVPIPRASQVKKVGAMPYKLFRVSSEKPIYATDEEVPFFLICSYDNMAFSKDTSFAYLRSDLQIVSVKEAKFGQVVLEKAGKKFDISHVAQCFSDLVSEDAVVKDNLEGSMPYGTIFLYYDGIPYLECQLTVYNQAKGSALYLCVNRENWEKEYYRISETIVPFIIAENARY